MICRLCPDNTCERCLSEIAARSAMVTSLRASTASPNASKDLLTEKQSLGVKRVADALATGGKVFTVPTDVKRVKRLELVKGQSIEAEREADRLGALAKMEEASAFWRSGKRLTPKSAHRPKTPPRVNLDKLECSFCGVEVEHHRATLGSVFKKFKRERVYIGVDRFEDKFTPIYRREVACPDCCLEIKPRLDAAGRLTNTLKIVSRTEL